MGTRAAKLRTDRLPPLTKDMFISQAKWSETNWEDTLRTHAKDINRLLDDISIFDLWKKTLGDKYRKIGQELLPEIFMDAYVSVHFACMGLYKQAHVCLRAELETALRLVYFAVHPVEYSWWLAGKDYFKKKDVWTEDYRYFRALDEIQHFEKACEDNGSKTVVFDLIGKLYSTLSQYVHTTPMAFLTTPDRFAPKYKKPDFNKWITAFKGTQRWINLILVLGFLEDFMSLDLSGKKKILKKTGDSTIKRALRKSLSLKFVGSI